MVYLTRRERFCAAHKLYVDDWSREKNYATFGKCANQNWHGHNYELFVTVKGTPDPQTGFFVNAKDLSKIIKKIIIDQVDHRNINVDVDFFPKDLQPTSENLAIVFWRELQPHLKDYKLHCIKLKETENIYVEYYGE